MSFLSQFIVWLTWDKTPNLLSHGGWGHNCQGNTQGEVHCVHCVCFWGSGWTASQKSDVFSRAGGQLFIVLRITVCKLYLHRFIIAFLFICAQSLFLFLRTGMCKLTDRCLQVFLKAFFNEHVEAANPKWAFTQGENWPLVYGCKLAYIFQRVAHSPTKNARWHTPF